MSFKNIFSKSIENLITGDIFADDDKCLHYKTVDDVHTGDIICIDCAHVVDHHYNSACSEMSRFEMSRFDEIKSNLDEKEFFFIEFIKDVCENMKLPTVIIDNSINYYLKLIKKMPKRKFPKTHLAAYSIYMTLNLFNCSRIPEEIEYYTGVSKKLFFKIETFFPSNIFYNTTYDLLNIYCFSLKLQYSHVKYLSNCVQLISEFENIQPQSLIAFCIYRYCHDNELYCHDNDISICMNDIISVCQTSKPTLLRLIRKYKDDMYVYSIFKK